jgi:uncharacterized protein YaaR (DUF327 family)
MPCRHNGAMVFMVKSCTAKINQPYICPFHTPYISFLQKKKKKGGGGMQKTSYMKHINHGFSNSGRYNTTVMPTNVYRYKALIKKYIKRIKTLKHK